MLEPGEEGTAVHTQPLCDEVEFNSLIDEMVAVEAPRRFAVVQEYGERVDARIAAWGMAFEGHAFVASTANDQFQIVNTPEHVVRLCARGTQVSSRLVWLDGPELVDESAGQQEHEEGDE
jgi:hypothetical protein